MYSYEDVAGRLQSMIAEYQHKAYNGGRNAHFYEMGVESLSKELKRLDEAADYLLQEDLQDAIDTMTFIRKMEYKRIASNNAIIILGITFAIGYFIGSKLSKKQ